MTAADRPRFLHRDPSRGYTDSRYLAAPQEPEAISEEEQRELTARAHRRWAHEQQRAWGKAAETIGHVLADFRHSGPVDRAVLDATKAVERAVRHVDRRVGRPPDAPDKESRPPRGA